MVSTPDRFTDKNPISLSPYMTGKNHIARKYFRKFSKVLDVKPKTSFLMLGASKTKYKAIRVGSMLWSNITNR